MTMMYIVATEVSRSDESVLEPDPIHTKTTARVEDGDDPIIRSAVALPRPRDDDRHDRADMLMVSTTMR